MVLGSGNVFADFGDADAEAKQLKAQIAADIIRALDRRGLSTRAGAASASVGTADIQRIRDADLSRFTLDRLIRIALRLGQRVELRLSSIDGDAAA